MYRRIRRVEYITYLFSEKNRNEDYATYVLPDENPNRMSDISLSSLHSTDNATSHSSLDADVGIQVAPIDVCPPPPAEVIEPKNITPSVCEPPRSQADLAPRYIPSST